MEEAWLLTDNLLSLLGLSASARAVLCHAVLVLLACLLAWLSNCLCRRIFVPLILRLTKKTDVKWDDIIFNGEVLTSASNIVPAVVVWALLPMVFDGMPFVKELLARLTAIYITVMSVRTCIVFINSFGRLDADHLSDSTQHYIKSFCGVLKILILFIATVIIAAIILGRSPMTLFAGLGATSAVLMLVFKDTIVGLVAGIRLTSNDMLHKGDWITVPGTEVNGTVIDISMTVVKVRNFDNTILTISPTTLVDGSFQNWAGMRQSGGRRVERCVYFDFRSIHFVDDGKSETNMGRFRRDMEEWLRSREDVNAELTLMVRQLEATPTGVPVEFYFFLRQKEWVEYEAHLADIMEHVYAAAQEYGLVIYQKFPRQ